MTYKDDVTNRLVCIQDGVNEAYWDTLWSKESCKVSARLRRNYFVLKHTQKYLPPPAKILEGGCGLGERVYSLAQAGYNAYGVDYAEETVNQVITHQPDLNIQVADVTQLPFEDSFFDGYWSLGVIEHFYNGYDLVVQEMRRVLKPGGILFLTVPVISPLRRQKFLKNKYPQYKENDTMKRNFYQFILLKEKVIHDIQSNNFILLYFKGYDDVKGLKDEINILKSVLQPIYDSSNLLIKLAKKGLDILVSPLAHHMGLFIFQSRKESL